MTLIPFTVRFVSNGNEFVVETLKLLLTLIQQEALGSLPHWCALY